MRWPTPSWRTADPGARSQRGPGDDDGRHAAPASGPDAVLRAGAARAPRRPMTRSGGGVRAASAETRTPRGTHTPPRAAEVRSRQGRDRGPHPLCASRECLPAPRSCHAFRPTRGRTTEGCGWTLLRARPGRRREGIVNRGCSSLALEGDRPRAFHTGCFRVLCTNPCKVSDVISRDAHARSPAPPSTNPCKVSDVISRDVPRPLAYPPLVAAGNTETPLERARRRRRARLSPARSPGLVCGTSRQCCLPLVYLAPPVFDSDDDILRAK